MIKVPPRKFSFQGSLQSTLRGLFLKEVKRPRAGSQDLGGLLGALLPCSELLEDWCGLAC